MMTIYIGADHRGFALKGQMRAWLEGEGYAVEDCGALAYDRTDDYPDYAKVVAQKVVADPSGRGIVICGSGNGVCITANRIPGVRAGLALSPEHIRIATVHDHLNVLCISADYTEPDVARADVMAFVTAEYAQQERHMRRIAKIDQ